MKKASLLHVAAGVLGLLLVLLMVFYFNDKKVDWNERYLKSDQPYDYELFIRLLEAGRDDHFKEINLDADSLLNLVKSSPDEWPTATYVAHVLWEGADSLTWNRLEQLAERGNHIMVLTQEVPYWLVRTNAADFHPDSTEINMYSVFDDTYQGEVHPFIAREPNKEYHFEAVDAEGRKNRSWSFFSEEYFQPTENIEIIGYLASDHPNFIKLRKGTGGIYLHTNPIMFTNYHLSEKQSLEYVNGLMQEMPSKDVVWMDLPVRRKDIQSRSKRNLSGGDNVGSSPLRIFLEDKAMMWSWYLLLAFIGIFLVFRGRRQMPLVPVIQKNTNTSVEFVEAIVDQYFDKKDHRAVVRQLLSQWLQFNRKRYHLLYRKGQEVAYQEQLMVRSGVSLELIEQIFSFSEDAPERSKEDLIKFYELTEKFYENCK